MHPPYLYLKIIIVNSHSRIPANPYVFHTQTADNSLYRAVAFDWEAHGIADGKLTNSFRQRSTCITILHSHLLSGG